MQNAKEKYKENKKKSQQYLADIFNVGNTFLRSAQGVNSCFPRSGQLLINMIAYRGLSEYSRKELSKTMQLCENTITEAKKKINDLYPELLKVWCYKYKVINITKKLRKIHCEKWKICLNWERLQAAIWQMFTQIQDLAKQGLNKKCQQRHAQRFMFLLDQYLNMFEGKSIFTFDGRFSELSNTEKELYATIFKAEKAAQQEARHGEYQRIKTVQFAPGYFKGNGAKQGLIKTLQQLRVKTAARVEKDPARDLNHELQGMYYTHLDAIVKANISQKRLTGTAKQREYIIKKFVTDFYNFCNSPLGSIGAKNHYQEMYKAAAALLKNN